VVGDVLVGVLVDTLDVGLAFMAGPEADPREPQRIAVVERDGEAEVGQRLALLLRDVLAVLGARPADGLPPAVRPDRALGRVAHALPDLVVVVDGVLGLVLCPGPQAVLEQPRVEDDLLGLGMEVEQVAQRLPRGADGVGVTAGLGVVEVGEATAERLVVIEDQAGHVGHGTIPPRPGLTDAAPA
jgi:hypothetical protein